MTEIPLSSSESAPDVMRQVVTLFSRLMVMHNGSVALCASPEKAIECVSRLLPILKWDPPASPLGGPAALNPADLIIDVMAAYPAGIDTIVRRSSNQGAARNQVHAQFGTLFVEAMRHVTASRQSHYNLAPPPVPHFPTKCERIVQTLNALKAIESRTLTCHSLVSLHSGSIRMVVTGLCFGILYYQTTTLYSLLACLFIVLKNSDNVWGLLIPGSFFQAHDSPYTLEVRAKALTRCTHSPPDLNIYCSFHCAVCVFVACRSAPRPSHPSSTSSPTTSITQRSHSSR